MHTSIAPTRPEALAALASRITQRRALFLPGGVPDADIDGLVDEDEADLAAMAGMPATVQADQRAKAATLAHRDLAGGMSFGEEALLRSLLADLAGSRRADA